MTVQYARSTVDTALEGFFLQELLAAEGDFLPKANHMAIRVRHADELFIPTGDFSLRPFEVITGSDAAVDSLDPATMRRVSFCCCDTPYVHAGKTAMEKTVWFSFDGDDRSEKVRMHFDIAPNGGFILDIDAQHRITKMVTHMGNFLLGLGLPLDPAATFDALLCSAKNYRLGLVHTT